MFTQCSKCETVFRLSAEVLRAAGGQVRCGKCGEVFNALAHLAEDPGAFSTGESSFDLETRADSILGAPAPPRPAAPPPSPDDFVPAGVEIARLQILDWRESAPSAVHEAPPDPTTEQLAETSLEFTLPPGELDRIFVETKKGIRPRLPPQPAQVPGEPEGPQEIEVFNAAVPNRRATGAATSPPAKDSAAAAGAAATANRAAAASSVAAAGPAAAASSAAEGSAATSPPGAKSPATEGPAAGPADASNPAGESSAAAASHSGDARSDARSGARSGAPSGFVVPEEVRLEMLSGMESSADAESIAALARPSRPVRRPDSPFGHARKADRAFIPWLAAAIVAAVVLLAQIVHQNRDWLAAHTPLGGSLRALYSKMGAPVAPPANLSSYQLRQWGVTGDPAGDGALRVRASILNTAAQLEPYPLLRVTLANRFGASIGTRDFEPAEYLGKPTAKLLAPGERTDATLDILDPGKNAEGFEIDVCLRGADRRVSCANDKTPAQAKR